MKVKIHNFIKLFPAIFMWIMISVMISGCSSEEKPSAEEIASERWGTDGTLTDQINDAERIKEEYEAFNGVVREDDDVYLMPVEVNKINGFVYKDFDDIREFSLTGTGVVFFGGGWCRYCRLVVPLLSNIEDIEIQYVSLERGKDYSKIDSYNKVADEICRYVEKSGTDFANVYGTEATIQSMINSYKESGPVIYPSALVFYNKGTIVGVNLGTVPDHSSTDDPLTEEEKEIFYQMFQEVSEALGKDPCPSHC